MKYRIVDIQSSWRIELQRFEEYNKWGKRSKTWKTINGYDYKNVFGYNKDEKIKEWQAWIEQQALPTVIVSEHDL